MTSHARRATYAVSALTLVVLVACSKAEAPASEGGSDSAPVAASPGVAATGAATAIHLVVTGGAHAGTYDAQSADPTCSYGLAGKGAWGNQYSTDAGDPKQLSSLQLVVPDAKAAAGGAKRFLMTVGFGPMAGGGTSYTVDTRSGTGKGGGTVTVEDGGSAGKVTFSGQTDQAVKLEGTITCNSVIRAE